MCLNPVYIRVKDTSTLGDVTKTVPCGKCPECLANRRRSWTHRLYYENFFSLSSFFFTLTYKDECLPKCGVCKSDVQKFLKRLRKRLPKFRYFIVSEYGDQFQRPHYHGLVFFQEFVNMPQFLRALEDSWRFGFVQVGDVTVKSIQYCSKYCLKDIVDVPFVIDEDTGEFIQRNFTFALMSRRPGIGAILLTDATWLRKHTEGDGCFSDVVFDNVVSLPRYFRDKIMSDAQKIKHNERIAEKYRGRGLDDFEQHARGNEFIHAFNRKLKK